MFFSYIPRSTFLAQWPGANFRDRHGHCNINVFYSQAAAGGRLFFMLSGRVEHGHLLDIKNPHCYASFMGSLSIETKIYKDV